MVGYSRLIRADEEGTLDRLKAVRDEIIDPKIAEHNGRIVKLMGDGMLVEFASVVDAARAAIEAQRSITEHNAGLPEEQRIVFRFAINLGDVVIDGDDIHGDGVNVAARLEGLARPGGVCVTGMVYEGVRDRIDLPVEDLGDQEIKNNINRPVRVWQWVADGPMPTPAAKKANGPLSIPDKASIAVLPLDSMSTNREHEYLADGMTEDIVTLHARVPSFFVIARNSTFSYRGQRPDIRQVGRDLGARYVVEGSLPPIGDRIRVTIQLIEAESGNHIWAERFDREADDLFEIQDEITNAIVARLEPELTRAGFELKRRRPPADFVAWDYYQQASGILALKGWNASTFSEGASLCRKAIALDPEFAPARAILLLILAIGHLVGYVAETDEALREADLALDGDNSEVLGLAGCALSDLGNKTRGIEFLDKSIEQDSSNTQAWVELGTARLTNRQPELAIEKLKHGPRISPRDNRLAIWGSIYALALGYVGRREAAIEQARIACRRADKLFNLRAVLAALFVAENRPEEAASALAEARRIRHHLSLGEIRGVVGGRYAQTLRVVLET